MADVALDALAEHRELVARVEALLPEVDRVARGLIDVYERDGRLLTFGNGGSAADAQHLAAELVGRYDRDRRPLAAVALSTDPSVVTCIGNDFSFEELFARQVARARARRRHGDRLHDERPLGERRRAGSRPRATRARPPCSSAAETACPREHADHALVVPSTTTARVQEMHLLLLHLVIEQVDAWAAA